jgi:hypothetical protein
MSAAYIVAAVRCAPPGKAGAVKWYPADLAGKFSMSW